VSEEKPTIHDLERMMDEPGIVDLKPDGTVVVSSFRDVLRDLINQYSLENGSNTPDYVLAWFLADCLQAFDTAINMRGAHYGRDSGVLDPSESPSSSDRDPTSD